MEAVTITLNGIAVSGSPGMMILDIARESGIEIPTLCHDSCLLPFGACRLCLVEDETAHSLLASCVTPIREGMNITTDSPRVLERRRTILQFILASHPDTCMVCDKGNRCQLRSLAAEMGVAAIPFGKIPQTDVIEEVNPFIERDLSKCILCGKCVRADQELVVQGAIDFINRSFSTRPATLGDNPLERSECTFCGTCVSICPTGALTEKDPVFHGSSSTVVETTCSFCSCGCSVSLEVRNNRVIRARPGSGTAVNRKTLCVRGAYGYDYIHSPERLTEPLIRSDDGVRAVSWDEALGYAAENFMNIKQKYGPDSLAVLGSPKSTNEENYLLQRLARGVLETNNIDNSSRLHSAATRTGLGHSIGIPGTTASLDDLEKSDVIMVIGANPPASSPAVSYAVKRAVSRKGAKLIVIDPRRTDLVGFSHLWLRPQVGTDIALINGFARIITDEGLQDDEFVARRTDDFEEFVQGLQSISVGEAAGITEIDDQSIIRAARLFAGAERASIIYGGGLTRGNGGTGAVTALANLALLTGNIGYGRGGIFAPQHDSNAQGACDMGCLPDFLPGYQEIGNPEARQDLEHAWGTVIPSDQGSTFLEIIRKAREGTIRGLLIFGENPVTSFPDPERMKNALATLEFLAVADLFPTGTAEMADVVFPAASFAEKEGTFTNFEGRIQQINKAIDPPEEARPDWQIITGLAESMGKKMSFKSPAEVMEEIESVVPLYRDADGKKPETEEIKHPSPHYGQLRTKRLFRGLFPSGFGRFSTVEYAPPEKTPGNGFPFNLVTGSILSHFSGGTRSMASARLKKFSPSGWVELNEGDASDLGCSDGDTVRIYSQNGETTGTVKTVGTLPEGMVFMPVAFSESPVNTLFDFTVDPQSETPLMKTCPVRLERIPTDG